VDGYEEDTVWEGGFDLEFVEEGGDGLKAS
jgi:hypothetical protein